MRLKIRKIKKYIIDQKIDNLGININIADIKKKVDDLSTSPSIVKANKKVNNLSIGTNNRNKNRKADNMDISVIQRNGQTVMIRSLFLAYHIYGLMIRIASSVSCVRYILFCVVVCVVIAGQ